MSLLGTVIGLFSHAPSSSWQEVYCCQFPHYSQLSHRRNAWRLSTVSVLDDPGWPLIHDILNSIKWNESGFRPPLCTYRLNWARRTSWGWWDDWDDTVLQTQDSKFEPWRSEAEHATSRSRRLPTILTFARGWGRNIFVSLKPPRPGTEPRTLAWKAAVLTTTLGPPPLNSISTVEAYLVVCFAFRTAQVTTRHVPCCTYVKRKSNVFCLNYIIVRKFPMTTFVANLHILKLQ